MGRPELSLLERVVDGSFRPVRYAQLLRTGDLLPEAPPPPLDRGATQRSVWAWLRHLQTWYRDTYERANLDDASETLNDFALLVRYLHDGRRPAWFTAELERRFEDGIEDTISLLDLVLDYTFVARRHAELLQSSPLLPPNAEIERLREQRRRRRS